SAALEKVKPALVFIQGAKGTDEEKTPGYALGIILDPQGEVVTNHSAIVGMQGIEVLLSDGRKLPARAILSYADLDLAIITIKDGSPLPHAVVGNSEKVKVGDWSLALNAPWTVILDEPLITTVAIIGAKTRGTNEESVFVVDTSISPGC